METDPRRWIDALRASHERLAAVVATLDDDALAEASMCTGWTVAQVLSHLGSGAEISRAAVLAATGDVETPGDDANEAVWARWNALGPREMATSFVAADQALVATYETLDDGELGAARIPLPFLPEPVDIATFAALRLGEHALHAWDVTAASDRTSEVAADAAELLIDRLPAMVALIGGFMPRESRPARTATISVTSTGPERHFELELGDVAELRPVAVPTATDGSLTIPAGALLRLTSGRLKAGWPAADVAPTGGLTMEELHAAFPGY